MATFGKYEVVTELHSTERGSVFSARAAGGGREIKHAVKTFNASSLDLDEQFWESQSFTERAKVQQRVSESGGKHWAPVYEVGTSPAGTYYVTDFHPLSAASLVTGRVDVSAGVLYSIVRSAVAGLIELKSAAGRAHGNLKATNVLIHSRGDVAVAGAVLTDPAPSPEAAQSGEAGDLYALGGLIHLLVLGQPFLGGADWPLAPARQWSRLGHRQGRLWRKLCNDLLSPDPASRPPSLDAVTKRLKRLVPRPARPSRRLSLAVAAVVVLLAAGAAAVLGLRDAGARKEVCAAKERWAGGLTAALAQPSKRALLESDPDLLRVVRELDKADLGSFDCGRPGGRFLINPDIRKFRQTQDTLAAVRRAERGLSPIQWRQLARAAELQGRFEARGWDRPAQHLANRIAAARPGSTDLADGIERFLVALSAVDENLPAVEEEWIRLQTRTRGLDDTRDPVMKAFAAYLRTTAASAVELSDGGFASVGMQGVKDASERAENLLKAHGDLQLGSYDEVRFHVDIVSQIKLDQVRAGDVERYLNGFAAYKVQEDKIDEAVAELKQQAAANEKLVLDSGIDEKQAAEFAEKLSRVNYYIQRFGDEKFIPRDIDDGKFRDRREQVRKVVASLKDSIRMEDVQQWLAKLEATGVGVSSAELTAYWNWWTKDVVPKTAAKQAGQRQQIAELQDDTLRLRDVLVALDAEMPQVPKELSDDVLVTAAKMKRDEVLGKLLKERPPISLARDVNPVANAGQAVLEPGRAFTQWALDLSELGKDFPIRRRILTPDLRPDDKWSKANPDFWNDRIVQRLVERDIERLNQLRALDTKPRAELLKTAESEKREELALHAWRVLGTERTEPAWPTRPGELEAEARIRNRLAGLIAPLGQSEEGGRALRELNDEAPRRWRRFVEAAGADEAMLASAAQLRIVFRVGPQHFSALAPEARFNLSLLEIRRPAADRTDDQLAPVVADLKKAAADLKDPALAADLGQRLSRLGEKEPFADVVSGDAFSLKPPGTDVEIPFKRVKPQGRRPFFLATTEMSFAQFAGVVAAHSGWDDVRTLVWSPEPGDVGDPRRGPRVWEWVMRPAPQMYPTQLWLYPDEANDFPAPLRDPRAGKFNSAALSEAAGGTPSERHPVQYVTPEAAMYVAGLAGCRLPTPGEWRTAYDGYEKAVPTAEWNLRDQTWHVQLNHAASAASEGATAGNHGRHLPDEGIYLPPTPKVSAGAAARSHAHRDGTLFFRPADAPGGGTFRHLVGNVAELVCEASEPFERLNDRRPARIRGFATESAAALYVVGGSALSPPEVPNDVPLPIKAGAAFADVGFRLAFTAPSKNLAEKLEWVLEGQSFIRPGGVEKTARAEKPPQS